MSPSLVKLLGEEVGRVSLDEDSIERSVPHGRVDRLPVVQVADQGRESDHQSWVLVEPQPALIPVSCEAVLENKFCIDSFDSILNHFEDFRYQTIDRSMAVS